MCQTILKLKHIYRSNGVYKIQMDTHTRIYIHTRKHQTENVITIYHSPPAGATLAHRQGERRKEKEKKYNI